MRQALGSPASSTRDRPDGLAPVGTSATFTFGLLYPFFTFLLTPFALLPWWTNGTDADLLAWVDRLGTIVLIGAGVWIAVIIPYVILYLERRYAAVWCFFVLGVLSAVAVPAAVLAIAIRLVASWRHPPDLVIFTYLFGACLLAMLATWPWLVRGLRLKYWQPWTTPDQWEVGGERVAVWGQKLVGIEDRRAATNGSRPAKRRR